MTPTTRPAGPRNWVMWVLAFVILVPALLGFGKKFLEFLALVGDAEGSFAIMPILNYLLLSLGFLFLFVWAMMHGMFRNIEEPKFTMMENEKKLDEEEEFSRERSASADPAEGEEWWQHGEA